MISPFSKPISSDKLPSYESPPVNEVVCGLRFHTPDKLRLPHIGLLWDKLRATYPRIQHAPPIATAKGEIHIDHEAGVPIPRVWFINELDDQLVQFQFDRFYFNWRRKQGDYPRYPHVIKQFENILKTTEAFFKEFELGDINPIEFELSYINHIPKGDGRNMLDDLPSVFSDFVWVQKKERFLPNPANIAWKTEFPLPGKMGLLTVTLNQAIRADDKVPLFVLELNARGFGELADKKEYRKWFDVAHEWIVRGFTDITTPEVHKKWGRE